MTTIAQVKVSELEDDDLDFWVAEALGLKGIDGQPREFRYWKGADGYDRSGQWCPSTEWWQGGPLLDEYAAALIPQMGGGWTAEIDTPTGGGDYYTHEQHGDTALIAMCRVIVAATFGATVPDQELE